MANQITRQQTQRVLGAFAAGTSPLTTATVDTWNFGAARFTVLLGALSPGQLTNAYCQGSDDAETWVDLAGTRTPNAADGDTDRLLIVDVFRPRQRYLRVVVDRGGAGAAAVAGVLCDLYAAHHNPPETHPTVAAQLLVAAPVAGTP